MRKINGILIATVLLGGVAVAQADEFRGTITAIEPTVQRITVGRGNVFELGTGITADQFKVGDRVLIEWESYSEGFKLARKVVKNPPILVSTGATGVAPPDANDYTYVYRGLITGIDHPRHMITLSTGDLFRLGTGLMPDQFRVGDYVKVSSYRWMKGYKLAQRVEHLYRVGAPSPQPGKKTTLIDYLDGNDAVGKVTALDFANNLVTLQKEGTFKLGTGLYASELSLGDMVAVKWNVWGQGYRRVNELEVLNQ